MDLATSRIRARRLPGVPSVPASHDPEGAVSCRRVRNSGRHAYRVGEAAGSASGRGPSFVGLRGSGLRPRLSFGNLEGLQPSRGRSSRSWSSRAAARGGVGAYGTFAVSTRCCSQMRVTSSSTSSVGCRPGGDARRQAATVLPGAPSAVSPLSQDICGWHRCCPPSLPGVSTTRRLRSPRG